MVGVVCLVGIVCIVAVVRVVAVVCVVSVVGIVTVARRSWCIVVYVGVVWSSCCSFCSYTRFILRDNNQNYTNPNLRERHNNCCVRHRFFVCLIYIFLC